MKKNVSKLSALIMSIFVVTLGTACYANNTSIDIDKEKDSIKKVVEQFVKDDYNFSGGKNDFSTVGSEELKKYLLARNEVKKVNYKRTNHKPIALKYDFQYKNFEQSGEFVRVDVYVTETSTYSDNGGITKDALAGDDYVLYLAKQNGSWKIMSATINVEVDPVDNEFNVNEELGYEGKKINRRKINSNLQEMLNKLDDLKKEYSKPLEEEPNIDDYSNARETKSGISYSQRKQIYDYAYTYRDHRRNPNYLSFPADCANYASQALRKAGARADNNHSIVIDGRKRTWSLKPDAFHIQPTYGDAWAQAHYLRAFIVRNENGYRGPGGHAIAYGSKLELGDLTFIYNGKWFHTYIVVQPGPNFKIASHTGNRWMHNINDVAPEKDYKRSYIHLTSLN